MVQPDALPTVVMSDEAILQPAIVPTVDSSSVVQPDILSTMIKTEEIASHSIKTVTVMSMTDRKSVV